MAAFLLLSKSDGNVRWDSNDGYEDKVESYYAFDQTVKNSGKLILGTRIFMRLDDFVIGSGVISGIDTALLTKCRTRCPKCKKATLAKTKSGFTCSRCQEHHDAHTVLTEELTVLATRVWYRNTWVKAKTPLHRLQVELYLATKDKQSAIRMVDGAKEDALIRALGCDYAPTTAGLFNFV